ncbi:UNVERIFIED_CONTAM: hypothetical protein Sradi_6269600 [Sesamum radiatum]|uniref:Secreted protein n=1 Tax=Sesamum radiatum TaxID=300843 RepID=A0AAW2KDX4_SESRA
MDITTRCLLSWGTLFTASVIVLKSPLPSALTWTTVTFFSASTTAGSKEPSREAKGPTLRSNQLFN